jgi:hypothetical protein
MVYAEFWIRRVWNKRIQKNNTQMKFVNYKPTENLPFMQKPYYYSNILYFF